MKSILASLSTFGIFLIAMTISLCTDEAFKKQVRDTVYRKFKSEKNWNARN